MLSKTPKSVLIVCDSERWQYLLKSSLLDYHYNYKPRILGSGNEARRELLGTSYDLIIINTPLSDEFGDKLANEFKLQTNSEIIILVNNVYYDQINEVVMPNGVMALSKPLSKTTLFQAFNLITVAIEARKELTLENQKLKDKYEELRVVSKAKCFLIEKRNMTEEEAHKYIEREAMDRRIKKIHVALEILNSN